MKEIIIYIFMLFSCKAKAQAYFTQAFQLGVYRQSVAVMGGYEFEKHSIALNYAQSIKYSEVSFFYKYIISRQGTFNIGLSDKIGFVNHNFGIYYPALELQWGWFQLGIRPINNGLLNIEPRLQIKIK